MVLGVVVLGVMVWSDGTGGNGNGGTGTCEPMQNPLLLYDCCTIQNPMKLRQFLGLFLGPFLGLFFGHHGWN